MTHGAQNIALAIEQMQRDRLIKIGSGMLEIENLELLRSAGARP